VWIYNWVRVRGIHKTLTVLRDQYLMLCHSAIGKYTQYMEELVEYHQWADRQVRPRRSLIPPCSELRTLLTEAGYDLTGFSNTRTADAADTSGSQEGPAPQNGSPNPTKDSEEQGTEGNSQVEDLLNLVDEQVGRANRSL